MKELISPSSFQWNVKESYANIAQRLGVDEETVRRRVARVQEVGFLQGWRLVLNPHLIGWESAGIDLEVGDPERKPAAISQLKLIEGVVFILEFHGRGLQVLLYHQNEQDFERKYNLIASICESEKPVHWKGGLPPCDLKLAETDWQILKVLRKDPRRNLSEVAKAVRASTRTVKRRLARMTDGKAFYILAKLDFKKALGVNCRFIIFRPDEKKRELEKLVRSRLQNKILFSFTSAKGFLVFASVSDNIAEADETYEWVKGLDGVQETRLGITKEFTLVDEWLDDEIERRLSATA